MTDLNSQLPAGSGWELTSAKFINDAGRVVGDGYCNGVYSTFVLDLSSGSDTTPPLITCPAAVTLAAGPDCQAAAPDLSAALVVADDCTPTSSITVSQSPAPGASLALGQHAISLVATDQAGNSAQCQVPLTVADQTPPTIDSVRADPVSLDPPKHQLIPVTVSVVATDECGATPRSRIVDVACNETVAPGEIVITGDLTVSLQAARDPSGSGRVYTITVGCTDGAGNVALGAVTVSVPKNGNNNKPKIKTR